MKGFKRGEKGFTLVELLIVVAILGILAAVVIPNVVGLMGRGGKQAFETDAKTVQLAAATFYSDTHAGWDPGGTGIGTWGNDANSTTPGHYYPTALAMVGQHKLVTSTEVFDDANPNNPLIEVYAADGNTDAVESDIQSHAIWMGLLVNAAGEYDDQGATSDRWAVSPLNGEPALYLNEMPRSAMATDHYNGDPGTGRSGGYAWVVGKNGVVFGAYPDADGKWYAGFSGAYP